jgi:hypothetical protein
MADRKFPNLFVIGAMKSGTTTLHDTLGTHPEVFMSANKEPLYFVGPDFKQSWFDDNPPPDPEGRWYFALFDEARHNPRIKYAGESSTDYAKLPVSAGCSERIRAFNPEARVLYVMRDPIERSISHYWHNVQTLNESRSIIGAIQNDPSLIAFSDYAMQLKPYLDAFPRDQIHLISLESFRDDRAGTLQKIFTWLGIDPSFQAPEIGYLNARGEIIYQPRAHLAWLARVLKTRSWRRTARRLPPKVRNAAHKLAFRPQRRDLGYATEAIEYLRPILVEKTRALTELLGRDFPEWKTTFPKR